MKVNRFSEATRYDAPNHHGFMGLCLQGFESDGARTSGVESRISTPGAARAPILRPARKFMSAWWAV
jgi:hypothetical protein